MVKMSVEVEALNHKQDNLQASYDVLLVEKKRLEKVVETMEGKVHMANRRISDTEKKLGTLEHDHMATKEEVESTFLVIWCLTRTS